MLDRRWRAGVERGLDPVARALGRVGITPDALTVLGVVFAVATALAVATGHLFLGAVGIGLSGLGDLLDGNLARSSGRTGPRGAFFDSVTDRISDVVVLGGFAWYLSDRHPHLTLLAFAVAALSMLISYERAKAEGLGLTAKGGLMERAERSILLALALIVPGAMVPVLWVMLALTAFTAVQRFVRVWQQAGRPPRPTVVDHEAKARRLRAARAVEPRPTPRLREWWEARAGRGERSRRRHPARRRTRP
jgi:CDP-diacylglycerol---glycerol-3-phosphate 3-phosphatidyltransferase